MSSFNPGDKVAYISGTCDENDVAADCLQLIENSTGYVVGIFNSTSDNISYLMLYYGNSVSEVHLMAVSTMHVHEHSGSLNDCLSGIINYLYAGDKEDDDLDNWVMLDNNLQTCFNLVSDPLSILQGKVKRLWIQPVS